MHLGDSVCVDEAVCLHAILQDVKPDQARQDSWVWTLEPAKVFSVKSCYSLLANSGFVAGLDSDLNTLLETIWKTITPSKVNVFGWRLFRESLPTRGLLFQRHVIGSESNALCPFC